jgi:hypothetical protein
MFERRHHFLWEERHMLHRLFVCGVSWPRAHDNVAKPLKVVVIRNQLIENRLGHPGNGLARGLLPYKPSKRLAADSPSHL